MLLFTRTAVLSSLVILTPILSAAAPQTQSDTSVIHSTTSEVLLDFVVRDKNSKIIRDLKPNEVQVFEDGVPQDLRQFEFIDGHLKAQTRSAPSDSSTAITSTSQSAVPPPILSDLRDISVVSVVIGNLDPRGREITLRAMRDFARSDVGPRTYVGVFSLGQAGLRNLQAYTNDASKISDAVIRATSDALNGQFFSFGQQDSRIISPGAADENPSLAFLRAKPAAELSSYGQSRPQNGPAKALEGLFATAWVSEMQDVYQDSMKFLAPVRVLAQMQSQIPGRKVILLFSAGLPVEAESVEMLRSVISTSNRANVSIYALDTEGLNPADSLADAKTRLQSAVVASRNMQLATVNGTDGKVTADQVMASEIAETSIHSDRRQNLRELAEETGGALLPDSLDLRQPIREAIESARTHYEATYAPVNRAVDGTYRRIEVRVMRPGAKVFARSGYYAVPVIDGRQIYPFELATLKAINTRPDLHQFGFNVRLLKFRPGEARTQYAFAFQAPTNGLAVTTDERSAKVHVCVTALIKDAHGEIVEKISKDIGYAVPIAKKTELERGRVSFTTPAYLASGHYTIETASVDRQNNKASVDRSTLDVAQESGFSISDVVVVRRVDDIHGQPSPVDPFQSRGAVITPELDRQITPEANGSVRFYAAAFPTAPIDEQVSMKLRIFAHGNIVAETAPVLVSPDANGAATVLASVPAAQLDLQENAAEVEFEYKGQRAVKRVEFSLVRSR